MKRTIGLAAAVLVVIGSGIAAAHDRHVSTGTLVSASAFSVMLVDEGRRLTLAIDETTAVVDELGRPLAAASLGAGDYIREECMNTAEGHSIARRITVLRPAWRALASPEN